MISLQDECIPTKNYSINLDKFVYSKMRAFFEEHAASGKSTKKIKKETANKDSKPIDKTANDDEPVEDTSKDSKRQQGT
jgi:hypothetical protein